MLLKIGVATYMRRAHRFPMETAVDANTNRIQCVCGSNVFEHAANVC